MKKTTLLLFTFLLAFYDNSMAQNTTTKDSITTFYNALIDNLESKYLNRKKVNWNDVKTYALNNALKAKDFKTSLETTTLVFDSIKCNHCIIFSEKDFYRSTLNKSLSRDDFNNEFLLEHEKQPPFRVSLMNTDIGYINMPGMLMIDLSKDSLNLETQRMYDKIVHVAKNNKLKGWVLDLRFNGGGNVYPMLASLHYLLGNNVVYKGLDNRGEITNVHSLKDGGFYTGEKLETKAEVSIESNLNIPVALIIGKMTGSSGEDIAVAFKNRKNTTFIGENSYGFLTGNDLFELPYDTKIALTVSYITDENKVYREFIRPDKTVVKKDNFSDLMKDGNIIEALKFIKK